MKTLRSLVVLSLVSFTSLVHSQYILTLRCNEMDAYIGKSFHVRVTETGSGDEVGRKTIPDIQNNTFEIPLYVLLDGVDYDVDFYVDVNGNGTYDAPPADHSWRRTISDPSGPEQINFVPDANYLFFIFPDDIQYGYYEAAWGGRWMNLTFGSTDSIEASLEIGCDSLFISFTTAGVFGNPATITFDFAEARLPDFDAVTDTLHFSVDAPWTGEVYTINGELHGTLILMGIGLEFTGTLGLQQVLCHYIVTNGGNPFANGYFYVKELEVNAATEPLELELTGTPISCHGAADGSIWSEVSGGSGNYNYSWPLTGSTLPHQEGVFAGLHILNVTDDYGCSVEASYTLIDPPQLTVDVLITDASCPGACDGVIELAVSGGTPPYSYSGQGEGCPGLYTIQVIDANGCSVEVEALIGMEPGVEILDLVITNATNGASDGSVEVLVDGGNPPYSYSLDGFNYQLSPVFTGLAPGPYCITISDAIGCLTKTDTFLIQNITGIKEMLEGLRFFPNPVSTVLFLESDIPVSIDLMNINGYTLKHSPPSVIHEVEVTELPRGIYLLRFSDGFDTVYQKVILH